MALAEKSYFALLGLLLAESEEGPFVESLGEAAYCSGPFFLFFFGGGLGYDSRAALFLERLTRFGGRIFSESLLSDGGSDEFEREVLPCALSGTAPGRRLRVTGWALRGIVDVGDGCLIKAPYGELRMCCLQVCAGPRRNNRVYLLPSLVT